MTKLSRLRELAEDQIEEGSVVGKVDPDTILSLISDLESLLGVEPLVASTENALKECGMCHYNFPQHADSCVWKLAHDRWMSDES